jgi:AmmeMemoRadiSam system protein A/AmmeMemoRadiSam system protein B
MMTGVVFGCIVPHPPLLVPGVGRGQEKAISSTVSAMQKLSSLLSAAKADTVVVVSPHGKTFSDSMGIFTGASSSGDMSSWGDTSPAVEFANDTELVSLIQEEAKTAGIPIRSLGDRRYELDHGVMVPLHYLAGAIESTRLVPVTFSWLSPSTHYDFGKAVCRAARKSGKRVAIIASGDLSHRLIPKAPAGFDPMGKVFDERLVTAIKAMDTGTVLGLDADLVEHAGECGYRSILILLGTVDGLRFISNVLSYEGPFGVGYLTAALTPSQENDPHPLVQLARDTVESYIRENKVPRLGKLSPEMREKAGVFVCLKKHGNLRGCIGTFEATTPSVAAEIVRNSIEAAIHDPRFSPVTPDELPDLTYSVDILTRPVPAEDPYKLNPRKDGLIVQSGYRRGLLLPDLDGVDTVQQQIEICCDKAGISPGEPMVFYTFRVKRYQ